MLIGQDFINMMKSFISPIKVESGGSEIVIRCLFCGDSLNAKHAHLYLKVPQNESELSVYHCKKCDSSGIVDDYFLRKYGCEDPRVLVDIAKQVSDIQKRPQYNNFFKSLDRINLINQHTILHKYDQVKIDYINNRIGSNFSIEDLISLKIFINLEDLIRQNGFDLTRDYRVVNALTDYFIGFISYDNKRAIMRKVVNASMHQSVDKRYINYNLIPEIDSSKSFYVLPTSVYLDRPEPVHIHIAEGVFDILSIFYNLNRCKRDQIIYIAAGGKSYKQCLEFILQSIGLINYIIHFYPDNDVSDQSFNWVIKTLTNLPCDIYIHRNRCVGEKDFGVKMNNIEESVVKLCEKQI